MASVKTIAICFNTPDLKEAASHDYGKKYPGAGWMKHLLKLDKPIVKTGEEALRAITLGALDPKDVVIVQEEKNQYGMELARIGADKRVLTCLESPIFAPTFYDDSDYHRTFKHNLFFSIGTEHLYFPSYDPEDLRPPVPWMERSFLCAVTSNKHYSMMRNPDSRMFHQALKSQLHDYRYQAFGHFLQKPGFKLYGRGWGEIADECADKIDTIRNYKFALCFENGQYDGYITEKIIDCFVAGVIPVYRGAKDVADFIPRGLFIDASEFGIFQRMEEYLRDFPEKEAEAMLNFSQCWINSSAGRKYSNKEFALRILTLCQ